MRHSRGFSLIELMIAVSLGLVAILAVGSVFIYGSRSYKEDDKVSRMQDELRFAMAQLSQDLEMAGFYAQIRNPVDDIEVDASATISSTAGSGDCGPTTDGAATSATNNWVYRERRAAVFTVGNATAAQANAAFPCIDTTEFYTGPAGAGTDVIAIKRLGGSPVTPSGDNVYLKTNGVQTTIFKGTGAGVEPLSGSIEAYDFKPVVWFLKTRPTDSGPLVPSLCRKQLMGGDPPAMTTECVAQGIEDMQFEFGFDANGNGIADYFVEYGAMPTVTNLAKITAVRVHLLARSSDPDQNYLNQKTYTLASQTRGPFNDKFHRRAQSSIVLLRNPTNLQTPQELPQ